VAVARELTKLYEDVVRGTLGTIDVGEPRGEYVIVLAGRPTSADPPDDDAIRTVLQAQLDAGETRRDAATAAAAQLGVPKRTAYALVTGMRRAGTLTDTDRTQAGREKHTEDSR
jgi:16S rRNA (cytidine1402-2'-O)-methyltransferase